MNNYPTETGWYWFRDHLKEPWQCMHVVEFEGGIQYGYYRDRDYFDIDGTKLNQWGPKIEEPK